ncbi:hypothetical protein [Viridibacterium curvum]|uniref:Uncharacterized protein n=1 Tax=Viridibacterium curvum TaxID=1101404 RepID=A0ABP9R0V9_9RHOO
MSEAPKQGSPSQANDAGPVIIVLALIVMVCVMAASMHYPFPDGKSLTGWDFVFFWFRELIGLALAVLCVAILGVAWVWRIVQNALARLKKND